MFNPEENKTLKNIWNNLGTFYSYLDAESKERVEAFWTALHKSEQAMKYNLYQGNLIQFLDFSRGFLEHSYQSYEMFFDTSTKNVGTYLLEDPTCSGYSESPEVDGTIYSYKITAVDFYGNETSWKAPVIIISGNSLLDEHPNILQWDEVEGASSYKIYGRLPGQETLVATTESLEFIDTGDNSPDGETTPNKNNNGIKNYYFTLPDPWIYMSIPTLSGMHTGQTLYENEDYIIEDFKIIKFLNPISREVLENTILLDSGALNRKQETFLAKDGIVLLPTLESIYFNSFGEVDTIKMLNSGAYPPYVVDEDTSYFKTRQLWSNQLKYFAYAISALYRRPPTLKNIQHMFSILMGCPFVHKSCTIDSIIEESNNFIITASSNGESIEYIIPNTQVLDIEVGDSLDKFDILVSGINVYDYIKDQDIIDQLVPEDATDQFYHTLGIQRCNRTLLFDKNTNFVNTFLEKYLPAGLFTHVFNFPPTGNIIPDKSFYIGGEQVSLSGNSSDPENDILSYNWTHLSPYSNYYGTPNALKISEISHILNYVATLTTPIVDTMYKFRLAISDSDNMTNVDINVPVSGTYQFSTWGDDIAPSGWALSDCELPFSYLG